MTSPDPPMVEQGAPTYDISGQSYVTIEHPCIVKNNLKAIDMLGGSHGISGALKARPARSIGLNFNPQDPSSRHMLSTQHSTDNVLLKITVPLRTGRKRKHGASDECAEPSSEPVPKRNTAYMIRSMSDNPTSRIVEAIGIVRSTHVFRSIPEMSFSSKDSMFLQSIEKHLLPGKYNLLKQWTLPQTFGNEDDDMPPPTVLSTQSIPYNYMYRQSPNLRSSALGVRGNRSKNPDKLEIQPAQFHQCVFDEPNYPTEPLEGNPPLTSQPEQFQALVMQLRHVFDQRPIWTRRALLNQLPDDPALSHVSYALAYVAYSLRSGPWRDCLCKLGIDPRKDRSYRTYQTVVLFLTVDKLGYKPESHRRYKRNTDKDSHIFQSEKPFATDGQTWHLCDIKDQDLEKLVSISDLYIRATCEPRYWGWYENGTLAKIKVALKARVEASITNKPIPPEAMKRFLARMPEKWDPVSMLPSTGQRGDDPSQPFMLKDATKEEHTWANQYRQLCRTPLGEVPSFGSQGTQRTVATKTKLRQLGAPNSMALGSSVDLDHESTHDSDDEVIEIQSYTDDEDPSGMGSDQSIDSGNDGNFAENDDGDDDDITYEAPPSSQV